MLYDKLEVSKNLSSFQQYIVKAGTFIVILETRKINLLQ